MKLNISGPQNSTVMENLSFKREEPNTIKNKIKNKGIQRCVVDKNMNQIQFKDCLFNNKDYYEIVHSLHSRQHYMIITETNKLALNNFDMKRYILKICILWDMIFVII